MYFSNAFAIYSDVFFFYIAVIIILLKNRTIDRLVVTLAVTISIVITIVYSVRLIFVLYHITQDYHAQMYEVLWFMVMVPIFALPAQLTMCMAYSPGLLSAYGLILLALYLYNRHVQFTIPSSFTYEPERMRPGSEFQLHAKKPTFQCEIHGANDDKIFSKLGQGFQLPQGIVTAAHVIHDVEHVAIINGSRQLIVPATDFEKLDGDLAIYRTTLRQTIDLALAYGKLNTRAVTEGSGLMAQVVAFGQRSMGFIKPNSQFGYCTYTGSTSRGFSGAPYHLNFVVYGMHLGGNKENLGYEAGYLKSLLKPSKTIVKHQESSDQWLIDQASRHTDFYYEKSPYHPDEYRVKINGSYHVVEEDVLQVMKEKARASPRNVPLFEHEKLPTEEEFYDAEGGPEEIPVVKPKEEPLPKFTPPKVEDLGLAPRDALEFSDSGNLMRAPAVNAGARGLGKTTPVSAAPRRKPESAPMVLESLPPSALSPTTSPTPTPAPRRKVSASTRQKRSHRARIQQLSNEVKLLQQQLLPILHGQQIYQQHTIENNGLKTSSQQPCSSSVIPVLSEIVR